MSDVTIPADVAKRMAEYLRRGPGQNSPAGPFLGWADLLDPKPPTLRDEVAAALADCGITATYEHRAPLVLAVVKARIEALTRHRATAEYATGWHDHERHVLALFGDES